MRGIEADPKKVQHILNWPVPKSMGDVWSFLGLVRYLADHLLHLADFTSVLNPLTMKDAEKNFPPWESSHQAAFNGIKKLVTSLECLTTIDHNNPSENLIFLTCDASDCHSGAVLLWGKDLQSS